MYNDVNIVYCRRWLPWKHVALKFQLGHFRPISRQIRGIFTYPMMQFLNFQCRFNRCPWNVADMNFIPCEVDGAIPFVTHLIWNHLLWTDFFQKVGQTPESGPGDVHSCNEKCPKSQFSKLSTPIGIFYLGRVSHKEKKDSIVKGICHS